LLLLLLLLLLNLLCTAQLATDLGITSYFRVLNKRRADESTMLSRQSKARIVGLVRRAMPAYV
jgi:hypothetical protein